jgi:hypothetical protein
MQALMRLWPWIETLGMGWSESDRRDRDRKNLAGEGEVEGVPVMKYQSSPIRLVNRRLKTSMVA